MKVLIVDDEKILLDSMEMMIDWDANGFSLIGKATSGSDALRICYEENPDIVVTDIKMRDMDGLELTKIISQEFPNIKVIIMSSFDDFSYAKKAIELKVSNYLVKLNTNKTDFLKALLDVKSEIDTTTLLYANDLKKIIRDTRDFFLDKLDINNAPLEILEFLEDDNKKVIVIALSFDDATVTVSENMYDIYQVLKELYSKILCTEYKDILYIAIPLERQLDSYRHIVTRLKSQVSMRFTPCSVGISSPSDFNNINQAMTEAKIALNKKFYTGKNSSIYWDDVSDFAKTNLKRSIPYEEFSTDISTENYVVISEKIMMFLDNCNFEQVFSQKQVFKLVEYIFISLVSKVEAKNFNISDDIYKNIEDLEKTLVFSDFRDKTRLLIEKIKNLESNTKFSPVVQNSIDFIMNNYKEPILLNDIAAYVNASPTYLSKLFKREVGENVTTYVKNVKINYAKQLLLNDSLNIVDIAKKLGFDSASYFTAIFQKHENCSPSDFRKNNK